MKKVAFFYTLFNRVFSCALLSLLSLLCLRCLLLLTLSAPGILVPEASAFVLRKEDLHTERAMVLWLLHLLKKVIKAGHEDFRVC